MLELALIAFVWGLVIGWILIFIMFAINGIIEKHQKGKEKLPK